MARVFENVFVLADLEQVGEDAAKLAAAPVWPLSDDELTGTLRAARRLEQTAVVLQARLVRQATNRGVPAAQGYRSTARWLRALLLLDPQPARELTEAATALQRPAIEQAMLDGHTDARQAAVIAAALDAIPADLGAIPADLGAIPADLGAIPADLGAIPADLGAIPAGLGAIPAGLEAIPADLGGAECQGVGELSGIIDEAERTMIEMAGQLAAHQLRRVGERILAHVAPQVAERADEAALARQEARAHRRRGLTLSLPVDGMVRLTGVLGTEDAATVHAALHPLCRPLPDDDRTPAQRRADALVEICRLALRTEELPGDGGEPPQLAVTVNYHTLTHALGAGVTDSGQRLSAATVRRLGCDARILPIVLGGAGQILDVGRARRLATGALRRALHIRDGGCAFPHCDRPPRWTDAHHVTAWTDGGGTTLDNLVLLCRHHHRLIHHPDSGWRIRLGADGHADFFPPPSIDPQQRPRRNLYHPRQ